MQIDDSVDTRIAISLRFYGETGRGNEAELIRWLLMRLGL